METEGVLMLPFYLEAHLFFASSSHLLRPAQTAHPPGGHLQHLHRELLLCLYSTVSLFVHLSPEQDREVCRDRAPSRHIVPLQQHEGAQRTFANMTTVNLAVLMTKSVSLPLSTLPVRSAAPSVT